MESVEGVGAPERGLRAGNGGGGGEQDGRNTPVPPDTMPVLACHAWV